MFFSSALISVAFESSFFLLTNLFVNRYQGKPYSKQYLSRITKRPPSPQILFRLMPTTGYYHSFVAPTLTSRFQTC